MPNGRAVSAKGKTGSPFINCKVHQRNPHLRNHICFISTTPIPIFTTKKDVEDGAECEPRKRPMFGACFRAFSSACDCAAEHAAALLLG